MLMLKQLALSQKCNQDEIAIILKTQQSEVSKMMNGHRKITDEHIDLLIEHFGKEAVEAYMVDDSMVDLYTSPQAKQVAATIIPAEIVEEAKVEAKEELRAELSIPVISSDVSTRTGFNIVEYIEENGGELEHINPSELMKGASAAEKVLTTSMMPTFIPGDIVFVRVLHDKEKIVDGATYYFNLKARPTMIRKAKFTPDGKLRLVAKNRDFGEIVIERADVIHIAKIEGLLRLTFNDQYDEIETLRAKKEQQIDNLIDEIRDSGKRTDRMMSQNFELMQKLMEKLK